MKSSRPKGVSRKISARLCREEKAIDDFVAIIKKMCEGRPTVLDLSELEEFDKRGPFEHMLIKSMHETVPLSYRTILVATSNVDAMFDIINLEADGMGVIDKKGIIRGKF